MRPEATYCYKTDTWQVRLCEIIEAKEKEEAERLASEKLKFYHKATIIWKKQQGIKG